jgi:hypothetical protein
MTLFKKHQKISYLEDKVVALSFLLDEYLYFTRFILQYFSQSKIVVLYLLVFTGEVVFDKHCPEESPDFIFGSEDTDFSPEIADVKVS